MLKQREMTPEEFLAYEAAHELQKFDFIEGDMVEVSPKIPHAQIQVEFTVRFSDYLKQNPIGRVYRSPACAGRREDDAGYMHQ